MAGLKDVAQLAGVDISTVSRVLNGDKGQSVRPETRNRIWEASRSLGYRPNAAARSLRTRVTNTLALLVPDLQNPVYSQILQGVQQAARAHHYFVLVLQTGDFASVPREQYQELLSAGRVDGLILADAQVNDELINELKQRDLPFVVVARYHAQAQCYVVGDDAAGARLAVEHLLQLGHRYIAHLSGLLYMETALSRLQGYRQALEQACVSCEPGYVVEAGFDVASGEKAMRQLLTLKPRPTAVFATNVLVAAGAIRAAYEAGLRVPADISIVAMQDIPLAHQFIPSITAVQMPLLEMGARAAQMLIEALAGIKGHSEVLHSPMELVVRESTAPFLEL